jgi:hypothetical protein
LEAQHQNGGRPAQQILFYPTGLNEAALATWIDQAWANASDAPMLVFLPQKETRP